MALLLQLDDIKARLGILLTDTTYDGALIQSGHYVTALFENHTQRGLYHLDPETDDRFRASWSRAYLHRYPVLRIDSVEVDGTVISQSDLLINMRAGWIEYADRRSFAGKILTVVYAGGYEQNNVPEDLAVAYAKCVGELSGYGTGDAPSSGGGGSSGAAPVSRLSLGQGALAVSFDTGGNSEAGGGTSGMYDVSGTHYEIADYAPILDLYKRYGFGASSHG